MKGHRFEKALMTLFVLAEFSSVSGAAEGLRYTMTIEPSHPDIGALAVFDLKIEGLSASSSRVAEFRLGEGLALESEGIRPLVSQSARGTAFRFELRVLDEEGCRIESLEIVGDEGRLRLGPIAVREKAAGSSEDSSIWRWVAPSEVMRYQAFEARLEPAKGSRAPSGFVASFVPPSGSSFEASGYLAWTVIAFEEGALSLPAARLGKGRESGDASASRVGIEALPPEIIATRAIGKFRLSLKRSEGASFVQGSALRLLLVLDGRGNLPVVQLPEPLVSLDDDPLPRVAWTLRRVDDARAVGGSYSGSTSLVVEAVPPRPGLLSLRFPAMAFLDPDSGGGKLEVPTLELRIEKKPAGEDGAALAELYRAMRRAPPFSREARDAKRAALERASQLGTYPPLQDALFPPSYFAFGTFFVALAGFVLFISRRIRFRRVFAVSILALAIVLGVLGLVSAEERRKGFVIVWTDTLQTVPSAESRLPVAVVKGTTARTRGASGPYESLVLADGVEGWALRDSLYWY